MKHMLIHDDTMLDDQDTIQKKRLMLSPEQAVSTESLLISDKIHLEAEAGAEDQA